MPGPRTVSARSGPASTPTWRSRRGRTNWRWRSRAWAAGIAGNPVRPIFALDERGPKQLSFHPDREMAARPVVAVRRSPVASLLESLETVADPTRLRLLRLLERHELEVAALCDILQLPQSTVSRHLKLLSGQGWLDSRPRGTTRLYRTRAEPDPAARRLWLVSRDQTAGWPTARQDDLRLQRRLSRRSPAEAFFAGAAGRWDRMREEAYGRAFSDAALLGLLPGGWVVADLGCGTGHAAAALSPHVGRVVGVDQSAAMLKAARKRVAGLANVEL